MLSVGLPDMLQKGDRCSPAGRAQTRRPAWSRCGEASHASKDVVGMRAPKLDLTCLALPHTIHTLQMMCCPAHLTSDMLPFRRALHGVRDMLPSVLLNRWGEVGVGLGMGWSQTQLSTCEQLTHSCVVLRQQSSSNSSASPVLHRVGVGWGVGAGLGRDRVGHGMGVGLGWVS